VKMGKKYTLDDEDDEDDEDDCIYVYVCKRCGKAVSNIKLHDAYHTKERF